MSGSFQSKQSQSSGVVRRKPNSAASSSTMSGRAVSGAQGSVKPTSKNPNASPQSKTPSPTVHKPSSPIKNPSPSTANGHSDSPILLSDACTKGEPNTNLEGESEPEEIKIISSEEKTEFDRCAICLDDYIEPKKLNKCDHIFCTDCIDQYFRSVKPQCPCCFTVYGEIRGNQPENGIMRHNTIKTRLPGFENNSTGTIQINYTFPNGTQDERHPNPGMPYSGTSRDAYLPDNREGRHVLGLLKKAFELRQTFTIGQSRTTGCDNVVTWNDIHHKTSMHGGMPNFGYPDKTYLNRVQQELAAKGIK